MGIGATTVELRDEATFWRRLTAIIVVVGLLLTTAVAFLLQRAAERERDLRFEAEASRVSVLVKERIDQRLGSFDSAINFVSATHPGTLSEYRAFMQSEVEQTQSTDPGVMFFETVAEADLEALVEREQAFGDEDFSVTLFPGAGEDRIILTRLAYESSLFGVSLLGIDVTALAGTLIPEDFGSEDFELYVLRSDDIFNFISVAPPEGSDFGQFSAVMVAPIQRDGAELGVVVSIMTIEDMIGLASISDETNLDFTLRVQAFEEAVAVSNGAAAGGTPALVTERSVETAALAWTIDVYADQAFAGSVGLLDQRAVWVAGIAMIILSVLVANRRQTVRRRLHSTQFELEHARTVASTDALTGLLNRNGLIDAARLLPANQPATLFFIDLDGFKSVNDADGHERGDQVLRQVANELRTIFRADDLVSRLGGDEFVVFARRSAPTQFVQNASVRITESISSIDDRVTCSVGVASRKPNSSVDVKDLLRLADAAMYAAKRSGGDRYEVAV